MPTIVEALQLGLKQHQAGHLDQAEAIYRQILGVQPDYPNALHLLGVLELAKGRGANAVLLLERAAAIDPNQSVYRGNLGSAYLAVDRVDEGLAALQEALRLNSEYPDAWYNIGIANYRLGRLDEAIICYKRCLRLKPDHPNAHQNLGVVLQDLTRFDEARQSYERALGIDDRNPAFHYNLGSVLKDQGRSTDALRCFERALQRDPNFVQAIASRGTVLLGLGEFAQGWADYERRVGCPDFDTQQFPQPRWDGSPLGSRTLLLHCEQGLGDTLQFIRYAKKVEANAEQVIVSAQPQLLSLLVQSGFQRVFPKGEPPPPFDVHAPLMSLPWVFRTELHSVPNSVPYLSADGARVGHWHQYLERFPVFKIGIAWQGGKKFRGDRLRSIPLEQFAPLASVAGARLFSLQKGPGSEQLSALAGRFEVVDLGATLDNESQAFLDTAAVMKSLDLVVTSDTAIAHLAGALDVPVWVALARVPEWRWLVDRVDSPWYPSMRLFRQTEGGQWGPVFEAMAAQLRQMI